MRLDSKMHQIAGNRLGCLLMMFALWPPHTVNGAFTCGLDNPPGQT